jgi:hemerythrin
VCGVKEALMDWSDDLSVGNTAMDEEHKEWLTILHELGDAINSNADRKAIGAIIRRMEHYTITHLTNEEIFMLKIKYPNFDSHKQMHDALVKSIVDIREKWESGMKYSLTIETVRLVKRWLTNHIKVADKKYEDYARLHDGNYSEAA